MELICLKSNVSQKYTIHLIEVHENFTYKDYHLDYHNTLTIIKGYLLSEG